MASDELCLILEKTEKQTVSVCLLNLKGKDTSCREVFVFSLEGEAGWPRPISQPAALLAGKLEEFYETADSGRRTAFREMLSDSRLMVTWQGGHGSGSIDCQGNITQPEALLAAAVFFQGLYRFLHGDDRYLEMDASLALLFAAWQWYHALKLALERDTTLQEQLENEFALAYRILTKLLLDAEFLPALSVLGAKVGAPAHSLALTRLRIQLSMVLQDRGQLKEQGFHRPIEAPGLAGDKPIRWERVRIHPTFLRGQKGKAAIRRLIRNYLLPHYDLESAYSLANLLRGERFRLPVPGKLHWFALGGMLFFLFVVMVLSLLVPEQLLSPIGKERVEIVLLLLLGLASPLWFDIGSLPHLALPRILGGVLIGYLAVVLQPPEFIRYLCADNGLGIQSVSSLLALLWAGVLLLSAGYLLADVHFMTGTSKPMWERMIFTFCYAVLATIMLGVIVLPLVGNPCLEAQGLELSRFVLQSGRSPWDQGYLIGPLGLVHARTLFAFIPIALFAGLISQFISEREPVTTTIWAPGEK